MTHLLIGWPLPADLLATAPWKPFVQRSSRDFRPSELRRVKVFVDTGLDRNPDRAVLLSQLPAGSIALVGAVNCCLRELLAGVTIKARVYGFCTMPYFLARDTWEITSLDDGRHLQQDLAWLGKTLLHVPDQPGMIAPRVVARIVNEAYFAVGEGVASRADIDLAVRLGVNYPQGPFAWGDQLGLRLVVQLLEALQRWGGSEAYQIAPALRLAAAHAVPAA